jgi:ATP-dependent DNA helicase RecG
MDNVRLLLELTSLPTETEWVEFKQNYLQLEQIGEYISAMANTAALLGRECGYLVWGVKDDTHELVGTTFNPKSTSSRVGNQDIEIWTSVHLNPRIDFRMERFQHDGKYFVICTVPAARHAVVEFRNVGYVRVGATKTNLNTQPEKLRSLLLILNQYEFEVETVVDRLKRDEIENLLSLETYYQLMGQPMPSTKAAVDAFIKEKLVLIRDDGTYSITNMGAILFAHALDDFDALRRKSIRIIEYKGSGRTETKQEVEDVRGYAVGFVGIIGRLKQLLPVNEVIENALRKQVPVFPEIALRELVANELIHQDFTVKGAGPMIEIFADRIEFTNPGESMVDTLRIIDAPPQSRNDRLASLMRRLNICEERGSGIDKVIRSVEMFQLPAPKFEKVNGFTRATLYAPIPFKDMDKSDRIRACYQHACLMYVNNQKTTNASVRQRFGLTENDVALATRIIRDTSEADKIKPKTDDTGVVGRRYVEYLPFWA